MNASVYIFGELAHGYEQYAQDFTSKIFQQLYTHAQGPTQLAIHREGDLMYYGYIRKLEFKKYIGFCVAINGLMLNDLNPLFPIFENAISSMVTRGDIIHYDKRGFMVPSPGHLHEYREAVEIVCDAIMAGFSRLSRYLQPLPPVNYATDKNFAKSFSLAQTPMQQMVESTHQHAFTLVYKQAGYNTDQMDGYSKIIKELHDENEQLETELAEMENTLQRMQYRQRNYTWVGFLLLAVGILLAVLYFKVIAPGEVTNYETGEFVYYGPMKDRQPNGVGVALYPSDDPYDRFFYVGNFVDGNRQDMSALLIYKDGSFFRGQMYNDNWEEGMFFDSNKTLFIGSFSFNQPLTGVWYQLQPVQELKNGNQIDAK